MFEVPAKVNWFALALCMVIVGGLQRCAGASAIVSIADQDPIIRGTFTGTINPGGIPSGQSYGLSPAGQTLNNIAGGTNNGATGNILVLDVNGGQSGSIELLALAIHVSEPGFSGSLSIAPNGALSNVVSDLNNTPLFDQQQPVSIYEFGGVPAQYSGAAAILAARESAVGGQPFDLVAAISFGLPIVPGSTGLSWGFDFSGEAGDGGMFDSIQVTDAGVLPEPTLLALAFVFLGAIGLSIRPPRSRNCQ